MRFVLLTLVLALAKPALAVPSLPAAEASLRSGDFEGAFEPFRDLRPGQHPDGDAKVVAFLVRLSRAALAKDNGLLAFDIADKATQLDPHAVPAYLVAAEAAIQMGNPSFARSALETAQQIAPDNAEIASRLNKLEPSEAPSEPPAPEPSAAPAHLSSDDESGIEGYAARSSDHFRIVYSEGKRDFAQKAQYEQRCLDLFERAYQRVTTKMGAAPTGKTEVVLYTKEEFSLHFGGQFGNSILGFFAGKIRMNRAEAVDDSFFDTAVHEFTHKVIDSIAQGKSEGVPYWLHEGLARWVEKRTSNQDLFNDFERKRLKRMAQAGALPTMQAMAHTSFANFGAGAWVAYAKSAMAIDQLMQRGQGLTGIKRVLAAIGAGTPFEDAFAAEFGADCLALLDDAVASELLR